MIEPIQSAAKLLIFAISAAAKIFFEKFSKTIDLPFGLSYNLNAKSGKPLALEINSRNLLVLENNYLKGDDCL